MIIPVVTKTVAPGSTQTYSAGAVGQVIGAAGVLAGFGAALF